jgi:uncharacterized membrane protein YtjA (UPF0391 family)
MILKWAAIFLIIAIIASALGYKNSSKNALNASGLLFTIFFFLLILGVLWECIKKGQQYF